jgi:hypothetical protein
MRVWVVLGVLALALGASGTAGGGSSAATTTRTIDRTLLCATLPDAIGKRVLSMTVGPKSVISRRANAGVLALGRTMNDHRTLVSIPPSYSGGLGVMVSRSRCAPSKAQVQLSRSGLPGPPTHFSDSTNCAACTRVLIRVRATLRDWKGWTRVAGNPDEPVVRDLDFARGEPIAAAVAVRTYPANKPVAFATLDRGRSAFYYANYPRCGLP